MRIPLLLLNILITGHAFAQCSSFAATIIGMQGGNCLGTPLTIKSAHALSNISWYQGSTVVATATATDNGFSSTLRVAAGGHGIGSGLDQLDNPYDLAIDSIGNIFIADYSNNRIVKWAPGAASGIVVAGGNGFGSSASQLSFPEGVFVDDSDNVYVSDYFNLRIQKWTPGADSGVTVAGGNGPGDAANQLEPFGLYVDCSGNIYIADGGGHRVQKWAPGAVAGVTVAGDYGPPSTADKENTLNAVWLDGSGKIYFTTEQNNAVQQWTPGAASGVALAGTNGILPDNPTGIWADYTGNVYVCNENNPYILKWPAGGNNWVIAATTQPGWKPGQPLTFQSGGMRIDTRGNLYTCEIGNARIDEWQRMLVIDSTFTPTVPGKYTAVVTDLSGIIVQTDTFTVIDPPPAPSSIQISASATATPVCTPIDFTATPSYPGSNPSYQWQVSGVNAGGDSLTYSNNLFADSDKVICIMSSTNFCTSAVVNDTSNVIMLSIDPEGHASIRISADSVACNGGPIAFSSVVTNGSSSPVYEWYLNGIATGDSTAVYTDSVPVSGQVLYCLVTSDASCGLAKSNSIPIIIYPKPSVAPGQVFQVSYGQSIELTPSVTGDINDYLWTPGTGLSDSTILDPVADPATTTVYTLTITEENGCKAAGTVTVDVYTPLTIPNAFTPNGDGHNDIFYVMAGPEGARIPDFAVYDRWGLCIFHTRDGMPGDPHYGWDGTWKGKPSPAGTYVYIAVIAGPNGQQRTYKGTVILVR